MFPRDPRDQQKPLTRFELTLQKASTQHDKDILTVTKFREVTQKRIARSDKYIDGTNNRFVNRKAATRERPKNNKNSKNSMNSTCGVRPVRERASREREYAEFVGQLSQNKTERSYCELQACFRLLGQIAA